MTEVTEITHLETLENIHNWVQRWYDNDFEDRVIIKAIESLVDAALEKQKDNIHLQ